MVYLGADHAGYQLKEKLKVFLAEKGYEVKDFGAFAFDPDDDYPDFIRLVAEAVAQNPNETRGVVLGGSGQGEAMVCNRYKSVRAAVYYGSPSVALAKKGGNLDIIKLSREHNNANVLAIGARFISEEEARSAVELWLTTPFGGGRHERRIEKIDKNKLGLD